MPSILGTKHNINISPLQKNLVKESTKGPSQGSAIFNHLFESIQCIYKNLDCSNMISVSASHHCEIIIFAKSHFLLANKIPPIHISSWPCVLLQFRSQLPSLVGQLVGQHPNFLLKHSEKTRCFSELFPFIYGAFLEGYHGIHTFQIISNHFRSFQWDFP